MTRFVLIGHPVRHSVSPAVHGAAYAALGLSHSYELSDTPDEAALAASVEALRRGELGGANVTVPWKRQALSLADRADASAREVGAANVLVRALDGAVVAHNTDVVALAAELAALVPRPRHVLVLGSGGGALAAAAAAQRLGVSRLGVSARKWRPGEPPASFARGADFARFAAELLPWSPAADGALAAFAAGADLVVQATSAGMHGAGSGSEVAAVVPFTRLARGSAAYDLVYNPEDTEFLRAARSAGLAASGGLGMLVGQAALAFELWLGRTPPRDAMQAAARAALRGTA